MIYIDQIISDLVDSSKTLADPLLKAKVLASRIGNTELLHWVNSELDGYREKDDETIPGYRRHGKQTFYYTYSRNGQIYEDQNAPLSALEENFRETIIFRQFRESIQLLEEQASGKHGKFLVQLYPIDMCNVITAQLKKTIPGIQVLQFKIMLHVSEITQVLSEIRNKLLGFVLEVEGVFPDLDQLIKDKSTGKEEFQQKVTNIFHTHIYARDNNTIVHGSDNTVTS